VKIGEAVREYPFHVHGSELNFPQRVFRKSCKLPPAMSRLRKILFVAGAILALQLASHAQAASGPTPSPRSQTGVVVVSVMKETEADQDGIKPGDVIDGWSRATEHGNIDSPFDFSWVEIEQKPRGPLSLQGAHGTERRAWNFSTDQMGLKVRPILREAVARLYNEGVALADAGKLTEATDLWRKAAHETTKDDPAWLASWLLTHAAEALASAQRGKDAASFYEEAVQKCPENALKLRVQIMGVWAMAEVQNADFEKGESLFKTALDQSDQSGAHSLMEAKLLQGAGLSLYLRDDLAESEKYQKRSLEIRQELAPDSSAVASSLLWLGAMGSSSGDLSSAQRLLEKALRIDSRLAPLSPDMAEIFNILGILAEQRGDLDHAEQYSQQTLSIGEKLGRPQAGTAAMLVNLGAIAQERGDFIAAERYLNESLSITNKIGPDFPVAAAAHNNLGSVLVDENKFDEGEQHLQLALTMKRKRGANNIRVASTLAELGRLAFKRNDLPKATEYLEQGLAIQRNAAPESTGVAQTLAELAQTNLKAGDLTKAEQHFIEAANIRQKNAPASAGYGEVLAGLGSVRLRQGKIEEATDLYGKAIAVLESQMSQLGGGSESRSVFRVANANYYRDYVSLLVAQGHADLALDYLERSRARTLLELLDAAHADIRKGVDSALLAQQRALQTDINAKRDRRASLLEGKQTTDPVKAVDNEISNLIAQYEDVQAKLRTSSPQYAALTLPQPLTSESIRNELLDHDTVLLEYSLGDERSYVFAVTPEKTAAFLLPKNADIESAALHLYKLLSSHPRASAQQSDEVEQAASKLSAMVLHPVAEQLRGKRIVVIADGALQYIPFAMLPDPDHSHADAAVPLVVKHEVVNLPSASVLAILRRDTNNRPRPTKSVAILADPVFTKDDPRVKADSAHASFAKASASSPVRKAKTIPSENSLPGKPLPAEPTDLSADLLTRSAGDLGLSREGSVHLPRLLYTREEAAGIRAVAPDAKSLSALDFAASRSTAISPELSRYRIIHFATHGLINSEHPELSGLVFSLVDRNGRQQDGFLQLNDIYNLNLPADLVVLSACETGLGKQVNGEGLIGLTRGFMYAGSSRVVASLWNVSDVATAQLMTDFYRAMEQDHVAPAAALRSAQIALWKQKRWHSPYFWAAFQIQGDWK
jgi:CHAT domain-containing protein/Tfp pilus assembly protein PilF